MIKTISQPLMLSSLFVLLCAACNKPSDPQEHSPQTSEASTKMAQDKNKTLNQILKPHSEASAASTATDSDCSNAPEQYTKWIHSDKTNHYTIEQKPLARVSNDPQSPFSKARFVPSLENGKSNGQKVFMIRPCSIHAALGLENGDVIHSENDLPLSSPDDPIESYAKLKDEKMFNVKITRNEKPIEIIYEIK